jgi:fluoroacetyl-CoA thioesterase
MTNASPAPHPASRSRGSQPLQPGLYAEITQTVEPGDTARQVGSGAVDVLATPTLICLMEMAAVAAVAPHLPPGTTSVGTHLDVTHQAPTPVGMQVTARAELQTVEGRRLTFRVVAHDEVELVGVGTHHRVLVDVASFDGRVAAKAGRDL